jgi:hypothetical protein
MRQARPGAAARHAGAAADKGPRAAAHDWCARSAGDAGAKAIAIGAARSTSAFLSISSGLML